MPQANRTFRVFISSTFSDLKAERNALQQEVFPALQKLCIAHDCRFQAIDLRWGVSEEADQNQRTMSICLDEIARCQETTPRPNFIILLGDRYGWQPLPEFIPAEEIEAIVQHTSDQDDRALLSHWYRRDDNAIPAVYGLMPRTREAKEQGQTQADETERWKHEESSLQRILRAAVVPLDLNEQQLRKYFSSATEQEIEKGALSIPDASEHVFCFFRSIKGPPSTTGEFVETNPDARARLVDLKYAKLRAHLPDNIREYEAELKQGQLTTDHLPAFCKDVYTALASVIQQEIDRLDNIDQLTEEIAWHNSLAETGPPATNFVGHNELRRAIRNYCGGTDPQALVIVGEAGAGKSALTAKALQEARADFPSAKTVVRFIGSSPDSSEPRALLESLCRQISKEYEEQISVSADYAELVELYPRVLRMANETSPLILFLDGLEHLSNDSNERQLRWLSTELPEHVRLVVSTSTDISTSLLEKTLPHATVLRLGGLSTTEGEVLLDNWLSNVGRTLRQDQRAEVISKFRENGLPLFLRLAFEEVRHWRSFDEPKSVGLGVQDVLETLFTRLEDPANHGQVLVSHALGLLSASRSGLSEDELVDLLSLDTEVLGDLRRRSPESPLVDRLPVVIWSRLYFEVAPYLSNRITDGVSTLVFFNRAMKDGVQERYLSTDDDQSVRHNALAHYFRFTSDPDGDRSWSGSNRRGFSELSYHLYSYARASNNNEDLYELSQDKKFQERQFTILEKLEPVARSLAFAVKRATETFDPIFTVRYAFARARLNPTLARTFLYRLPLIAKSTPGLAASVVELIPNASTRHMAMVLVARILADSSTRKATARELLLELASRKKARVDVFKVPALLCLMRQMVEADIDEAYALTTLIPECPLRRIIAHEWANSSPKLKTISSKLEDHVLPVVSASEMERFGEIDSYAQECWMAGIANRNPSWVEEQAVRRYGTEGASYFWQLYATRFLVTGATEGGLMTFNRGLYLSQGQFAQPMRTQMALVEALSKAGVSELALENRDKVTSGLSGTFRFMTDPATRLQLAPIVESLSEWHSEMFYRDPKFYRLEKQAREAIAAAPVDGDLQVGLLWSRLSRQASAGNHEEALVALGKIMEDLRQNGFSAPNSRLIATYAMGRVLENESLSHECQLELHQKNELHPEVLFGETDQTRSMLENIFDELLSGPNFDLAATAVALRIAKRREVLYEFVEYSCRTGADTKVIDAIVSQVVLVEQLDSRTLERVHDELNVTDHNFGVATGLGMYYFRLPWIMLIILGVLCLAIGSSAVEAFPAGVAMIAGGVLGALYDLLMWRNMKLWQRPERSRNRGTEAGTGMAIWATLFFLQAELYNMVSSADAGYAFFACLGAAAVVGAGIALIAFLSATTKSQQVVLEAIARTAKSIYTTNVGRVLSGVLVLIIVFMAFAFSNTVQLWLGGDSLKGVFWAGSFLFAIGLNLVMKHVPVRRYYAKKGIKLGGAAKSETFVDFKLDVEDFHDSRLRAAIVKAEIALNQKQYRSASEQYTRIIADSDFESESTKTQYLVYLNRGFSQRALRKFEEAISDYQWAMAVDLRSPSAYMNMGLVLAENLGEFEEALQEFSKCIERDPLNVEAFSSRALVKEELGDIEGAETDLDFALSLNPKHANSLTNMGNVKFSRGRFVEAAEYYGRGVEAAPRDFEIRFNHALALTRMGKDEEAQRVLRQDPQALQLWRKKTRGPGRVI